MRTDSTTANMVNIERTVATVANADMLQIETHINADDNTQFLECERGSDIEFRVWGDGDVNVDGTYSGPADFAEMIHVSDGTASVEPGDVMVIDINNLRSVVRATITRSTLVMRVYSTKPGYLGSEHDWDKLETSLVPADLPDSEEETGMKPMALGKMIDRIPLTVVGILLLAKFPRRTARFDPATCWSLRLRPATPCATVIRRLARLWEKP